jgi:RNA polymerase sigma-70 factor (ECF subfamily)
MLQPITISREQLPAEDAILMARIVCADPIALELLYKKYQRKVYAIIIRIVGRQEDAHEITQDVFLQVWCKATLFDVTRGTFTAWLLRIAHNMSINLLRSRLTKSRALEVNQDPHELSQLLNESTIEYHTPLDDEIKSDEHKHVLALLQRIPDSQRTLLMMSYYEGYSQSEIAAKLSQPIGTVKTRMRIGLTKLNKIAMKTGLRPEHHSFDVRSVN